MYFVGYPCVEATGRWGGTAGSERSARTLRQARPQGKESMDTGQERDSAVSSEGETKIY